MVFAPAIAEFLELLKQILWVLGRQVGDEIALAVAILTMALAAEATTFMPGIEIGLTPLIVSHDGLELPHRLVRGRRLKLRGCSHSHC